MRTPVAVLVVLFVVVMTTPQAGADSLGKPYFAATSTGAWAKYESNWEMPDGNAGTNIYTYIRTSDSAGRVRIEVATETLAGPGKGMTSRQLFIMKPEFDLARDFMNRMVHLEASATQTGETTAALMPANVIEIIRSSAGDLTNSVVFRGKATKGGHECDDYAYSYKSGGAHVTLQEGEICFDENVPFGVVYQKGRVTDETGELLSSFEEKLIDSGAGESGSEVLLAMTPEATSVAPEGAASKASGSMPLVEAYQSERIRLFVEVVEGSGGRRLDITVLNQAEELLDLVVPVGSLTIAAGTPIGTLNLIVGEEQRFALSPGASSSDFSAGQPGERGVTGGKFQLAVYEGDPIYQGSVEVGPLN